MDEQTKQQRLEAFERSCREQRTPFTVQRRAILEAVLERDHPTADEIHDIVSARIPAVSRTTVYRTLETLVRMRLINKAWSVPRVGRYDTCLEPHHHMICERCERIVDVSHQDLDDIRVQGTSRLEFEVTEVSVQFRGTCSLCRVREEGR